VTERTNKVPVAPLLLDVKELAATLGICARSCWRLSALAESGHGSFPRPLRIGPKTIRWRLADVQAYISALAGGIGHE
jgi:predicted DNA-binding transcriptional regulator AlpA